MAFVLVVDDDPVFREVAGEILRQEGHEVIAAGDGDEALRAVEARGPDLAVVDMLMPNRDGLETLRDLRQRWPDVRVIAVSGGARGADIGLFLRAAQAMGADATAEKPLEREAFLNIVRGLVGL